MCLLSGEVAHQPLERGHIQRQPSARHTSRAKCCELVSSRHTKKKRQFTFYLLTLQSRARRYRGGPRRGGGGVRAMREAVGGIRKRPGVHIEVRTTIGFDEGGSRSAGLFATKEIIVVAYVGVYASLEPTARSSTRRARSADARRASLQPRTHRTSRRNAAYHIPAGRYSAAEW